jgi:hypothetical protein
LVVTRLVSTLRKQAEEALSSVSYRVIETEERERQRIAHELHENIGQRVTVLYLQIDKLKRDSLVLSEGGFLSGSEDPHFSLKLAPHVNILIGDRGSGKSTALNLLGLLADSVSEEADDLVTKLLALLDR